MDPLLDLLNQRPRKDWSWDFEPTTENESAINAVALCNAALLTYSAQADIREYLGQWGFEESRILRGFSTQGFVARRDSILVVAFRGTEPIKADDWLSDINYYRRELAAGVPGRVHGGFANALGEIAAALTDAVAELAAGEESRVFITGHSLGGALAVLAGALLHFVSGRRIAGVFTYGQPRVGDPDFSAAFDRALGPVTFRYVNDLDVVPHIPPTLLPARPLLRVPARVMDFLRTASNLPEELLAAANAMAEGERFEHVGRLRLFRHDGTITSDELEWQQREVIYSGTLSDLLKSFPQLLRAQLGQLLRAHNRILDHDPVNGYLSKLEAWLHTVRGRVITSLE
jgi:triacylglycerol lipase